MKTILTTMIILALFISSSLNAQSKVLKVNFNDKKNEWTMYPPNTKFSLIDSTQTIYLSEKSDFGLFVIDKKYRLEIYPKYKEEPDVYILAKGSIEIVERDYSTNKKYTDKTTKNTNDKKHHSSGVAATKIVTDSKTKKGRKNLVLKFTNGVVFTYIDGKTSGKLYEQDLYIKGNYLVYSKLGVAKISFNPKNGETWWVFK